MRVQLRSPCPRPTLPTLRAQVEHKDFLAINVYVALAYAKLDYYDVSNEVLGVYLTQFPDSVLAINLKACNQFRKGLVKEAEEELRVVEKLG